MSRAKLLTHFLLHPGEKYHVRELERLLGESAGNLLRDLRRFREIKLLEAQRIGNQVRYSLDRSHPLYEELQRLILKITAAEGVLREALLPLRDVELAFIYGSFAKGQADTRSDLDVLIVGSVPDEKLAPAIASAERALGREVSYSRFTRDEARLKAKQKGSFIQSVLAGPRIVVIGGPDDELFQIAQG